MKIGDYEIEEQVGKGGMGVVYSARTPAGERVAVKVLSALEKDDLARFEREQRLLGKLSKAEGFVPLIATGKALAGPYIVMPFLEGGTLRDRLLKGGTLSIAETVALGLKLARALGRAHQLGVVHRDVKPENILFGLRDGEPDLSQPLIADLGLAKHFRRDVAGASQSGSITREDDLYGTAQYMAPEQWEDLRTVGPPADVFALGSLLYECLTGVQAFAGPSLAVIALSIRSGRFEPLRVHRPEVPASFARAVERAFAAEASERYPDGESFARALAGFERRPLGRTLLLVGVAVLAALVVTWLTLAKPAASGDVGFVPLAPPPAAKTNPSLPPITRSFRSSRSTKLAQVLGRYEGRHGSAILCASVSRSGLRALTGSADRTLKLWDLATGAEIATLESHTAPVRCALISPGNTRALSGGDDRTVRLWDVEIGRPLRVFGEHGGSVRALAFTPDGRLAASGADDASVKLWEVETGREVARFTASGRVLALAFTEDTLRAVSNLGKVSAWDLRTLTMREVPAGEKGELLAARFSDRGESLVVVTAEGFEVRGDGRPRKLPASGLTIAAISPDGTRIATGDARGRIVGFDLTTNSVVGPYPVHAAAVTDVAWVDSRRVVSVSEDHALRVTSIPQRESPDDLWGHLEGHAGAVLAIAPHADGRVLTGGLDGSVHLWSKQGTVEKHFEGHAKAVTGVAWRSDGKGVFSASWDGTVRAWDARTLEDKVLAKHGSRLYGLARSPDGQHLFAPTQDGLVLALDSKTGELLGQLKDHEGAVLSFEVAKDGKHGLSAGLDGTARFWDLEEGGPTRRPFAAGRPIFSATFLDDPRSAVVACRDGSLLVASEPPRILAGHEAEVFAVARSGSLLVSASQDQTVRLWDLETLREVDRIDLRASTDYGEKVAFAPDGRSFYVGTARGVVLHFELTERAAGAGY